MVAVGRGVDSAVSQPKSPMSDITGRILHEDDVESETNFVRNDNLTQDVADDDDDES